MRLLINPLSILLLFALSSAVHHVSVSFDESPSKNEISELTIIDFSLTDKEKG